jgi:hypothetical protein
MDFRSFDIQFEYILDCPEAPHVPNAEIIEKFGLYRSVGRGIKHRCQTGYQMTGSPFAVCSHLGFPLFHTSDYPFGTFKLF